MARRKVKAVDGNGTVSDTPVNGTGRGDETTGRWIVVFGDEAVNNRAQAAAALRDAAGCRSVATSDDYEENAIDAEETKDADAVVFSTLGIAVVAGDGARMQGLTAAVADAANPIAVVEPERVYYAIEAATLDYLRGYRDAAGDLFERFNGRGIGPALADEELEALAFQDTAQLTWGLQAIRANTSRYTGQGIRVAVLDTGLDLTHPDFAGRQIFSQSFVAGEPVQDGHSHGTHCIGTACGPKQPASGGRRYGIAHGCQIFAGKVLSNQGSGTTGGILAGMEWAINSHCQVISMSLGNSVSSVSQAYETAGRRALERGSLIVAAAGNNGQEPPPNDMVCQPANSPSIMAVGAVNSGLERAPFSARSNPVPGGKVDLVAPGAAVYSSVPKPQLHGVKSGTSMATPHTAGCAALWCQATGARGSALWNVLIRHTRVVNIPAVYAGTGLVQAPQ